MDAEGVFMTNDNVDSVVDRVDEISENINLMCMGQLKQHCRMLEMIGQQQMSKIREQEKEIDKLAEEKGAIDVELAVEIEGREVIEKRMEEMKASEKLAIEEVNSFLLAQGLPKIEASCILESCRFALESFRHLMDSLYEQEAQLNKEIDAFENDRSNDASEHKAIMFALISFGILMAVCTVGIIWTAVA